MTMIIETVSAEQTWRLLWSHAAKQVITYISAASGYSCESIGYGWGLRSRSAPRRALVLHPSSNTRGFGDLALTVGGTGTGVIPRNDTSFAEYIKTVTDIVEDTLNHPTTL